MFRCTGIAMAMLFFGGMLLAQPPGDFPGGEPRMERKLVEMLKLTESQRQDFERLMLSHQKKMIESRSKIALARIDLREAFMQTKPDRADIEKKLKAISDLQHLQKLNHVDHWFAVSAILTPDQLKIWKEHKMHLQEKSRGPMGHRQSPHQFRGEHPEMHEEDD